MKELKIKCDNALFDTVYYDNQIELELTNPDLSFIGEISAKDIIYNCGDVDGLLKELSELEDFKDMMKDLI